MDQNFLLSADKLTLNPDLQRGWMSFDTFVIKNVPAQTYLRVSTDQATVLRAFADGKTVPEAFAWLLKERLCLPVREFYELVLKAHDVGILWSSQKRLPVRQPIHWRGAKAGTLLLRLIAVLVVAAFASMAMRTPPLSIGWGALVVGWGLALTARGAGRMFAASVLVGAGGSIYPGKSRGWLRGRLDLRDTVLLRPVEQALVALAENLPLTLCLLATLWEFPVLAPPLAAVWLLDWRPWGAGLPHRLANLMSRYPKRDTDGRFLFLPNLRPQLHWRPWWRRWDWRVCVLELTWAAGWSLLVARIILDGLGLSFVEMATDWDYWSVSLPVICAALLVSIVITMLRRWRDGIRQVWRGLKRRVTRLLRHWRHEYVFPDNEAALLRLASSHPLLGQLNPYDQAVVVRAWRPATFKPWKQLAGGNDEGTAVGLILSGRAEACRIKSNGLRTPAFMLEEGDFFGLPHLMADEESLLEVKSRTPVAAMLLPMDVFKTVVTARLKPAVVHDLTHKYAFLQRLPVCVSWHPHAVARFARISLITSYADGDFILHEGQDAHWFYIIFDGVAQVRRRGKLVSRLKAGEFFGEISLLQSSATVADVVAQGQVRCLQIDRTSFLRFMTYNHHVALRLEKISSARLGRPIFPLGSSIA